MAISCCDKMATVKLIMLVLSFWLFCIAAKFLVSYINAVYLR